MTGPPTGIITFLLTDIEGSTQEWERQPDVMRPALALHDACLRDAIEGHGGYVFKTIGDAFCAAFSRAADAVGAAIVAQQHLQALQPSPPGGADELALKVRIILHSGTAEADDDDYFGVTLSRARRVLDVGYGGQVLLSQSARDLAQHDLPPGASLRDLGRHRLRHLLRPEHIYQLLHPDLPVDFPPLRSVSLLSHNLSQQMTRFVGREREMARIREWLATTRLLTLTGTGGAGKTRLALQVAAGLWGEFEEGVWLVELAALMDPELVVQAVATTLAVPEEPGRPLIQTLVNVLKPRQTLLILDNCEHLLAVCAGLVQTLLQSCPHLSVLTTSRARLNIPGEQTYRVPPLSTPDPRELASAPAGTDLVAVVRRFEAVQMFLDRAALVQPSFALTQRNALAVAQVCHQLDGIPLAIELVVARLRLLSVEQIAPRLADMFRLLPGGSRTALPRQQTLRALIDWSHALLSEAERTLLRRLSVFINGFTLEAAAAVTVGEAERSSGAWIEPDGVLALLGQLVDKSLVLADDEGRRYHLQETLRQYASEKLWESGEGVITRWRFRNWALDWAERALPELASEAQILRLRELVTEYHNLRAALGPATRTHPRGPAAGEPGDLPLLAPRVARWGQVVEQIAPAYRMLGHREAARGLLDDFIALCEAERNPLWQARALTLKGRFNSGARDVGAESASALYERAIAICEAHGLEDWLVQPRSRLAYELASSGADLERAERLAYASLSDDPTTRQDPVWREPSDQTTVAQYSFTVLMLIAVRRADWTAFRTIFQESLGHGGPLSLPVQFMLGNIEESFHLRGAAEEFRELCRFMIRGYAAAGLTPPFQQWFLEPAMPQLFPGEPEINEPFAAEGWHSMLQWQDVTGRSRFDQAARPGWLGLYPAEESDLWPGKDLNAPRLMVTVQGDYAAQTRVELGQPGTVFAGLLVWQDRQQFARLELRSIGRGRASVNLEACLEGEFRPIGRGQCERQRMWLRVERVGNELRALCSEDGEQWLACGATQFPRCGPEQVGLATIWQGAGTHAWFDTFLLWRGRDC